MACDLACKNTDEIAPADSSRPAHASRVVVPDEAATARGVSRGVLGAAAVIAAIVLVAVLALAMNSTQHSMEDAYDRGSDLLGSASTPDQLDASAEELQEESNGLLASIAGEPEELRQLAQRMEDEAARLRAVDE